MNLRKLHLWAALLGILTYAGHFILDAARIKQVQKYDWLDFNIEIHFSVIEMIAMWALILLPFLFFVLSLVWNHVTRTIFASKKLNVVVWVAGILAVLALGFTNYLIWSHYIEDRQTTVVGRAIDFFFPAEKARQPYEITANILMSLAFISTATLCGLMAMINKKRKTAGS